MKYSYELYVEEDTNDGDYINKTTKLGVFDTDKEEDMNFIRATLILLDNFNLDYGNASINIEKFKNQLSSYDIDLIRTFNWKERPENDEQLEDWLMDYVFEYEPWMDNCDNNHSFSYTMTKVPASVKKEIVSLGNL